MSDITIKELDAKFDKVVEMREKYLAAKRVSTEINSELSLLQNEIADILEALGRKGYKSNTHSLNYRWDSSFKMPTDLENRGKLFNYLRHKDMLDVMTTIHSRTLNAFAKEEADASDEIDFQIPGLIKSEPRLVVSIRKI